MLHTSQVAINKDNILTTFVIMTDEVSIVSKYGTHLRLLSIFLLNPLKMRQETKELDSLKEIQEVLKR